MKKSIVFVSDESDLSTFKLASNYDELEVLEWNNKVKWANFEDIVHIRFFDPLSKQNSLPNDCWRFLLGKSVDIPSHLLGELLSSNVVSTIAGLWVATGKEKKISFSTSNFSSLSSLVLDAKLICDFGSAKFPMISLLDIPLRNAKDVDLILSIPTLKTLFVSKVSKIGLLEQLFSGIRSVRDLTIKTSNVDSLPEIAHLDGLEKIRVLDLPNICSIKQCLQGVLREVTVEILYCKKLDHEIVDLGKIPNIVLL